MERLYPATETVNASDARQQLPTHLKRVFHREARVLIEKSGIPVAAIVSASDLARLERLDKESEADFAIIEKMRKAFDGIPAEEIERETDRALERVRARNALTRR
jgi:prevent-host-death family protein